MDLGRQGGRQQGQKYQRITGQEAPSPRDLATFISLSHYDPWVVRASTHQALCLQTLMHE